MAIYRKVHILQEPVMHRYSSSLGQLVGCQQITTVGFRPEANAIVERLNAEIKRHLQSIVNARQVHYRE